LSNTSTPYGIVVFSHLRWSFVWQRPQQFLSRFAEKHPVLFVEISEFDVPEGQEPRIDLSKGKEKGQELDNVTVFVAHFPPSYTGSEKVTEFLQNGVRETMASLNISRPLLWFYNPMDSGWTLGQFGERGVVYDCMDELAQFKDAHPMLVQREAELIKAADVVFTGGYELWTKKSKQHPNTHFFGCAVEYDHFGQAQEDGPIPDDLAAIPGPRVGWFGVVDERVDYDLLKQAAAARPDVNFVIVGPAVKVDPKDFPQAPNLHWMGGRDYAQLPLYCRGYDVCMMCFALNEATEFINPTKALEYLATGKPVISTAVRDVVRQYQDTVKIAHSPEEFVSLIDDALAGKQADMVERGIEKARDASWESTVSSMQAIIEEAIESKAVAA
jgi:glycosyltransferase involved in cell wall biosynthesis